MQWNRERFKQICIQNEFQLWTSCLLIEKMDIPSGANVYASDAAQYSTLYPILRSNVHNHLSSPERYKWCLFVWIVVH